MTVQQLEQNCLSLRVWITRCVLPAGVVLLAMLLLLNWVIYIDRYRDQSALMIAFFTLYFVLVRGGHLIMIRSLHAELKRTYGKAYEKRLERLAPTLRRQNIGFTLARIKRELIDEKQKLR